MNGAGAHSRADNARKKRFPRFGTVPIRYDRTIKADDRIASIYFSCRASELSLKSAPDNTLLADLCIRSLVFPSDFDIHFLEGGGGKKCSEPLIEINGFSRPLLLERIDRIPPTIDRSITRRSV